MPIVKPISAIIHRFHFRGNTYSFLIEATLKPQQDGGQLSIQASPGYLLTTLDDLTPQAERTISYKNQPDGSWLVQNVVTLLTNGSSLIDGAITLQDPLGESVVLLVSIETALFISDTSVAFGNTEAGGEALALLKVSQQGADTPVSLSVNNPALFGLASDKAASTFADTLTVVPSFEGDFICIRYSPNQAGRHTSSLLITTPYDSQTVFLEGRATRKASQYQLLSWPALETKWSKPVNRLATTRIQKILAVVLVVGLVCVSYIYKCELVPGLCQSRNIVETDLSSRDAPVVSARVSKVEDSVKNKLAANPTKKTSIGKYPDSAEHYQFEKQRSENTPEVIKKVAPRWRRTTEPGNKAKSYYTQQSRIRWQKKSAKSDGRSDLEKELNNTPIVHP